MDIMVFSLPALEHLFYLLVYILNSTTSVEFHLNTTSLLPQETITAIISGYGSCTNMIIMLELINQLVL